MESLNRLSAKFQRYIITDPNSIYYFTGCCTPGASFVALVYINSEFTLVVRELEMANYTVSCVDVIPYCDNNPIYAVADILKRGCECSKGCNLGEGPVEVGFDGDSPRLTAADARLLFELLTPMTFVDISEEVKYMRVKKTQNEIDCIAKAASYVSSAYQLALRNIRIDMPETELAGLLSYGKMCSGSEWTAYPEFVSFGANGCIGHHTASRDTRLKQGELVFMEVGASHMRYHAARMHCFWTGVAPLWFDRLETCIRCAMSLAATACVPGTRASVVDRAMRDLIEHAFDDCDIPHPRSFAMLHRSGYSIGIGNVTDWADKLIRISPTSSDIIEENMVLHLIPWLQIDGIGAMGFSDTAVVRSYGLQSLFSQPLVSPNPRIACD